MKATCNFRKGNCNKGTQVQAKTAAKQSTEQFFKKISKTLFMM